MWKLSRAPKPPKQDLSELVVEFEVGFYALILPCTVEPLNVNTLKSGHLLYSGHFVLSQRNKNVYYFSP